MKPEPQIHNKKFTLTAAREFAMYKGQFMPLNANDSDTLIDMARLAREMRELKQNEETSISSL
jgi:hypothetical protein